MTLVRDAHEGYGASFRDVDGRDVVEEYGRPARTHVAVRNGVGVTEAAYGVVVVTGDDRVEFLDNAVTNAVPTRDGAGCYALLLDPQGGIRTDFYVYNAGDKLLVFTPPGQAADLADEWADRTFVQDVDVAERTNDFAVFGVHGPNATEKVASVLNHASTPEDELTFVRGSIHDEGVTVVRSDNPPGEEGFEVVCGADAAFDVFDTLVNHGMNAVPFGRRTWETLTLEAGTPLYETELAGTVPNVLGLRNALDFEKGCYVGQEVVSRVENQGRPSKRLVGLRVDDVPAADAAVFAGDEAIGAVTRAADCPTLDGPAALALVDYEFDPDAALTVRIEGADVPARQEPLPFVEGSARSARLPDYPA